MLIKAKNTKVSPVYWAHLRKWPFGVVVEYDVSDAELASIKADERITVIEEIVPVPAEIDINSVLVDDGIVAEEKRGPGRPRKAK